MRSASGKVLTSYVKDGTILVGAAGDGRVSSLGIFPLSDGGVVYGTLKIDAGAEVSEVVAWRNADGHLVKSTGIPGVSPDIEDSIRPLTRLPGGSIRGCMRRTTAGGDEIRLVGLTPALEADSRLGPSFSRVLAVTSCDSVASDPAGRTYVLGHSTVGGDSAVEVSAYDANGGLMTSWGAGGHQTIALPGYAVVLGRGQIVAAVDGSMLIPAQVQANTAGSKTAAAILSLGANGVVNTGFSGDGIATFQPPSGGHSAVFAMDADNAGRPIVSLVSWLPDGHVRAMLARVTTGGTLDASFGNGGVVMLKRAAHDLDVDAMNRIVCVAPDGGDVRLTRRT